MQNKSWATIIALLVVAVGVATALIVSAKRDKDNRLAAETEQGMMHDDKMMADDKMEGGVVEGEMMPFHGSYLDYSAATVAAEQKAGHKVVLFFHAAWCPFCKAADAAFKANLGEVPKGVTILKTDYDSQTELKQKYGITYQHTFVQIDSDGNQVSKWSGGDIDNLKKYVK